jgi:hypothetical protein
MAKMIMKMTCLQQNDYDISFSPNDGQFSPNEVGINLEHQESLSFDKVSTQLVRDQALINPSINSWRKTKGLGVAVKEGKELNLSSLISPDVNMYLAMSVF